MSANSPTPFTGPHLLIPFAVASAEAWLHTVKSMPPANTRNLAQLLKGMKPVDESLGEVMSLTPPHERFLAQSLGLANPDTSDGLMPWAAQDALALDAAAERAWAWVTPCHWAMGREHATLSDPAALALEEHESRTLMAAMQPYFETDGITLHYVEPARWLAEGEIFRDQPTASLDRVLGRNVDAWLPGTSRAVGRSAGPPQARPAPSGGSALHEVKSVGATLRRLQNEMQMLLYTHPLNDARAERRQRPVNSIWMSGTGSLPDAFTPHMGHISTPRSLAQAVFADDWAQYADAWAAIDAGEIAALLARQSAGESVRLTLCGERGWQTLATHPAGLMGKFTSLFGSQPAWYVGKQL